MARRIIPLKLIATFDAGEVSKTVLIYKVDRDGSISRPKTISIQAHVQLDDLKKAIRDAKQSVETSEGL